MRLSHVRTSAATLVATMLLAWQTGRIYRDPLFTTRALGIVGAMVLIGLLVRLVWPRARWHAWPGWALQTVGGGALLLSMHRGASLPELIAQAIEGIETGTAPLHASPGLSLVFLTVPWLVCSLLELFVHVGRMPGLTILPLAAWYAVFALVPSPQASVFTFAAVALGYLAILAADTANRAGRWRHGVTDDTGRGSDVDATVARTAATVLLPAFLAALVVGSTLPLFTPEELAGGNGTVSMSDPKLDLRQNLHASRRREVLTYRTDAPEGQRLHLAVLTDLTREGWEVRPFPATPLTPDNQIFPDAPGVDVARAVQRTTDIEVSTFPSTYLPMPYAPRGANLTKRWGVDPATLTVYTMEPNGADAANHMAYHVTSTEILPTAEELNRVTTARSGDGAEGVPATMPDSIRRLTEDVVAGAKTPLEKASALQSYFRNGSFTYDINVAPTQGGFAGLEQFLLVERVGYCEQYASAYAAMARIAGLPSRVVVGFLPGDRTPAGTYSVANLDMHAWPEVWFDGYGWLPFEPTPPDISGAAPAYTQAEVPPVLQSTPTPTPTQSSSAPVPAPSVQPPLPEAPTKEPITVPWRLIGTLLGLVALALLAAAPRWWRSRRRAARLASTADGAERTMAWWHELRDTVVDLGLPWPAESPRAIVAGLENRTSETTSAGLMGLAVAVERVRFAPSPGQPPADGGAAVSAAIREITTSASQAQRTRATWLPASLWRGWFSPRPRGGGARGRAGRG